MSVIFGFPTLVCLSVDIGNYKVKGRADSDQVGYHVSGAGEIHNSDKIEAGTLEVNPERSLVTR